MKVKDFYILILASLTLFACHHSSPESQCGPCPEYPVIAPFLELKFVDVKTGANLLLSPTSPYKFSDLRITSSVDVANVDAFADTADTNNRFVGLLGDKSQTFILKLAALPADTLSLVTKNDSPRCCPVFVIKQITLDNNLVCSPCSLTQSIVIRK
jgi:hypothetical protein